jgi:hypothetical protein
MGTNALVINSKDTSMATFADLFHRHIAGSVDKQMQLSELRQKWPEFSYDLQRGKFAFTKAQNAPDWVFDVQVVGWQGADNMWTWVWSNQSVPSPMQQVALEALKFGQQEGIAEFLQSQFPVQPSGFVTGPSISGVLSCMHNAFAYIAIPQQAGSMFILLRSQANPYPVMNPMTRMAQVFQQLTGTDYMVPNLKRAFEGYCAYYSLEFMREGNAVVATHPHHGTITATFNDYNKLLSIEAKPVEQKQSTGLAGKFLKKG